MSVLETRPILNQGPQQSCDLEQVSSFTTDSVASSVKSGVKVAAHCVGGSWDSMKSHTLGPSEPYLALRGRSELQRRLLGGSSSPGHLLTSYIRSPSFPAPPGSVGPSLGPGDWRGSCTLHGQGPLAVGPADPILKGCFPPLAYPFAQAISSTPPAPTPFGLKAKACLGPRDGLP